MKSIKAKTKAKKPNGKFRRVKFPPTEVASISSDLSELSQPIDTSISNLYRVTKILENGSDEVKSILTYECDLVYECRICRSLFRSLVNFISHKRIYCKEKVDVTFARKSFCDYTTIIRTESDNEKTQKLFHGHCENDGNFKSQISEEKQKKDLTSIITMLQKKHTENFQNNSECVYLESVQSNSSAVYQTVESVNSNQDRTELMKTQITELKDMINGKNAVLDPNGQLKHLDHGSNTGSITQNVNKEKSGRISENDIVCSICSAKFSTKKTLAVHTRTLHTSHRLCYPCPFCSSTFANTWSVYRHLFKIHRKTSDQVRRLRTQIQEKAFFKDTTVAEDLQKEDANKTLMNDTLRINETQEWIEHLESDSELQRCGGCGKRFDRRAALLSHSQYCHRRVAACESTKAKKVNKVSLDPTPKENIVIIPEIQKDVNTESFSAASEINNSFETPIRVETVASLSKEDWDMLDTEKSQNGAKNEEEVTVITNGAQKVTEEGISPANDISDPIEIVYTNINKPKTNIGSKKRKRKDKPKKLSSTAATITKDISSESNTEQETEIQKVDNVLLMEEKVASIINLQKLQCLSCKRKFMSATNLRRHAAIHIGWNRYKCKLCDFKCFVKCDCVAHCNKMHNAQNNRVIIEDMIALIPDDQCIHEQDIMLDITNVEKESGTPEVTENHVESEVQIEEKTVNKTEIEIIDTNSTCQEVVHINGETEEVSNVNNKDQNTAGLDPDIRKMVMEVIFGSSEVNSAKETTKKSNSKLQNIQNSETVQSSCSELKESEITSIQNNLKPQRPIRNKMKPLNKDFVYDLKDVAGAKDSLIMKPFSKSLRKKPLLLDEDNLDRDTEQPSKRFKSIQNAKISILCDNNVINKCDIKLSRVEENLKGSLAFPQCHS
nr:PREDICTED: zinc finger protein 800 [Megachile rotundata]XP_012143283.1 PREDICTED: zinc finger protein 800 [Megachile rotundata]